MTALPQADKIPRHRREGPAFIPHSRAKKIFRTASAATVLTFGLSVASSSHAKRPFAGVALERLLVLTLHILFASNDSGAG